MIFNNSRSYLAFAFFLVTSPIFGAAGNHVSFGPFVANGEVSDGAKLQYSSGLVVTGDRRFALGRGMSVGPALELSSSYVNTKQTSSERETVASYDHKGLGLGGVFALESNRDDSLIPDGLYVKLVGGRAVTNLDVTDATDNTYRKRSYGDMTSSFARAEVGTWYQLQGNLNVDLALTSSMLDIDQSQAQGSSDSERRENGRILLTSSSLPASENELAKQSVQRLMGLRFGLTMGF